MHDRPAHAPQLRLPHPGTEGQRKDILHEIETRANQQLNGKVRMDLVGKVAVDGSIRVDQGIVAGCSGGTFENVCAVAQILKGKNCGAGTFRISVYPDSMPTYLELVKNGAVADIVSAGGIFRECLLRPLLRRGRHPRQRRVLHPPHHPQLPQPGRLQARRGPDQRRRPDGRPVHRGHRSQRRRADRRQRGADEPLETPPCRFDAGIYEKRVYNGWGKAEPDYALKFGPNIKDWPEQPALTDDLLLKVASYITDPVTTTDELIPSGETSSYRSNPLRLAEFTLSRKIRPMWPAPRRSRRWTRPARPAACPPRCRPSTMRWPRPACRRTVRRPTSLRSLCRQAGDGSAREQAASCQRVLGGAANFASSTPPSDTAPTCINWGMLPFLVEDPDALAQDSYVFVPGVRRALLEAADAMTGYRGGGRRQRDAGHAAPWAP